MRRSVHSTIPVYSNAVGGVVEVPLANLRPTKEGKCSLACDETCLNMFLNHGKGRGMMLRFVQVWLSIDIGTRAKHPSRLLLLEYWAFAFAGTSASVRFCLDYLGLFVGTRPS